MNRLKDAVANDTSPLVFDQKEKDYIEGLATSLRPKDRLLALAWLCIGAGKAVNAGFILRMLDMLIPDKVNDIRWKALTLAGDFVRDHPALVWPLIVKYGAYPGFDIRRGVACCLLEHLLEYHFDEYFAGVRRLLYENRRYIYALGCCQLFGEAEKHASEIKRLIRDASGQPK